MEGLPVNTTEFIDDEASHNSCEVDEMCTEQEELFDTCCSLCDNGGDILCCEGRCMRSFHATEASDEGCESLGLSEAQVRAIQIFICKNCQYQQHQCFICGKLGSSDISSNAEVFPCIAANCGRFYHPSCIAKELQQRTLLETENLDMKIGAGKSFVCPAHRCFVCKQVEDRTVKDMQFAVCRRCPKSYHRKCLPREIIYDKGDYTEILPRAWDNLLPKRILIYCLDHEIDPVLRTPLRNHIRFPFTIKLKKPTAGQHMTGLSPLKKRRLVSLYSSVETVEHKTLKAAKKVHTALCGSDSTKVVGDGICKPSSDGRVRAYSTELTSASTGHVKRVQKPYPSSTVAGGQSLVGNNKLNLEKRRPDIKPSNAYMPGKKLSTLHPAKHHMKKGYSSPVGNIEMERRITALMEQVHTSFDVDEFMKSEEVPCIYTKKPKEMYNKNLTKGKVEVACKAIREAMQKLDSGGSLDDAMAVCSIDMLRQVPLWKSQLRVYLAPFMHGTYYSSYGRHFTKSEKLQEIVNRLHSYVLDGDMIVDFCCGANEFSSLMKEKLDSVGKKKCSFKNYDLFPPKNDFNFERKDWFDVDRKDLPTGSQLVMGLNPPFGLNASLANKFINKALQFNPKLLILIVPPETHRLDSRHRKIKYDLLWEDKKLLAGEAFYLPGAFDDNDKQISQWNNTTPPLYLWSRPDWTGEYMEVANSCGHSWSLGKPPCTQPPTWNHLPHQQQDGYFMGVYDDLPSMSDDVPGPMNKSNENMVLGSTQRQYMVRDNYCNIPNYENPGTSGICNTYSHYGSVQNSYSDIPSYESPRMAGMCNTYGDYGPMFDSYSNIPSYESPGMAGMCNTYGDYGPARDSYSNVPSYESPGMAGMCNTYSGYGPMRDSYRNIPNDESPGMAGSGNTYSDWSHA